MYGSIVNAAVMIDENGKSRSFGFVNFVSHDAAAKAVKEVNGSSINGCTIHCSQAQKKEERGKTRGANCRPSQSNLACLIST